MPRREQGGPLITERRKRQPRGEAVVVGDERLRHIQDMHRAKGLITPALGLSEDAVFACRLAISEAVANAFAHGQRNGKPYCRVRVQRECNVVRIAVEDHGAGFKWQGLSATMPSPEQEHGRGVHLIRVLMDGVSILSTPRGTRIEMVKLVDERTALPNG